MSRYDGENEEWFPNQADLWQANLQRAMSGRRGQAVLRELEAALLELPEKRLISSHLALNGQVCAMGALVAKKRCDEGRDRSAVLAELEQVIPPMCECWHTQSEHEDGAGRCNMSSYGSSCDCQQFTYVDDDFDGDGDLRTAEEGKSVGLVFALAWEIGYQNDRYAGYGEEETPEQRYERILDWVRKRIIEPVAA